MNRLNECLLRSKALLGSAALATLLTACGGGGGGGDALSTTTDSGGTVSGVALGTASLAWSAPSQRTDGQPLLPGEIQGYRVYYGTSTGKYSYSIDIMDGTLTSYNIDDLPLDTYYFVLTTLDVNGQESSFSAEAVKTVSS